ncbi:tetratricopeptide repeat protein [Candidatus Electronema sp. PJ]|uniref:tetratricopeptide repeat protein n=1 Tax=Candidatus Electronema sp. PJ TaxID=3401572 RepID=UPI003AA8D60D
MATEEFCRLGKELYSAEKEFGRFAKEFWLATKESCRLRKELKSAKLLYGRLGCCNLLAMYCKYFLLAYARDLMKTVFLVLLFLGAPSLLWADDELTARIRKFAEQGDPKAEFSMGLRYDLGDGLERNPELAAQWFRKAAEHGIVGACLYLGLKHEFGNGVKLDQAMASSWYERAALLGSAQAAFLLGNLYRILEDPDTIRGCVWLEIAAKQGYPGAEKAKQESCFGLRAQDFQEIVALIKKNEDQIKQQRGKPVK